MKTTDPRTTQPPLNTHTGIDGFDARVHYPKGFRTAFDNSHLVKNNVGEIEYQSAIQCKRVVLTDADIKALNSTPFEAVAAPGEDLILMPFMIQAYNNYGSATYDCKGGALTLVHEADLTTARATLSAANFGEKTEKTIYKATSGAMDYDVSTTNNQALMLYIAAGDPITGDGTWIFDIFYTVFDLSDYDSGGSWL